MPRTVTLPPISRIEGHGRVSLFLDDEGRVADAHFNVIEFRGFEKFVEGRMVWEMPLITSRVCGICPVSHHVAAVKAVDDLLGVEIPRPARLLRELLQTAGFLHDHALHFFFLAGPDILTGVDPASRNLLGVVNAYPELAAKAIAMRKVGQRVVAAVGGQAGHPVTAIPGGMSIALDRGVRDELLAACREVLPHSLEAERLARECTLRLLAEHPGFASTPTPFLAMLRGGDVFDLYDGDLVASKADGTRLAPFPVGEFFDRVDETVLPWSYCKVPYLTEFGPEAGRYRVGPLARVGLARTMGSELADGLRAEFESELGHSVQSALAYHWARMIELVAAFERVIALFEDEDVVSPDVRVKVERRSGVGVGAVEAPRGTLVHRYEADEVGRVTSARLVVATTQNNAAINAAVLDAVRGARLDEGALDDAVVRRMELGIRAYDPCLSCSTHEAGRVPLAVEVVASDGSVLVSRGVGSE
ncbi:MAG: Ni/Fe hydrogenase subunit alpha [Coriobacteriia bacterium]